MAQTFANYINGQWVEGSTFEVRNPANNDEVVGLFVKGSAADVDAAAQAAQEAFPAWANRQGPARASYLFKAADWIEQRWDSIAADMTREEGKTLPEAKGEVGR